MDAILSLGDCNNDAMRDVVASHPRCQILNTYDWFAAHCDTLYQDDTHINAQGHEWIARGLFDLCSKAGDTQ